jgi:antitoxin (DNA-binding transcriptional repressor) of toxin-antitoxin stability system
MKRYSVSVVRERLSEALDEAERGEPVVIERRGVRYRLTVERAPAKRTTRRKPRIEVIDHEAFEHGWTWDLTKQGLRFRRHRP